MSPSGVQDLYIFALLLFSKSIIMFLIFQDYDSNISSNQSRSNLFIVLIFIFEVDVNRHLMSTNI